MLAKPQSQIILNLEGTCLGGKYPGRLFSAVYDLDRSYVLSCAQKVTANEATGWVLSLGMYGMARGVNQTHGPGPLVVDFGSPPPMVPAAPAPVTWPPVGKRVVDPWCGSRKMQRGSDTGMPLRPYESTLAPVTTLSPFARTLINEADAESRSTAGPKMDFWVALAREARQVRNLADLAVYDLDLTDQSAHSFDEAGHRVERARAIEQAEDYSALFNHGWNIMLLLARQVAHLGR